MSLVDKESSNFPIKKIDYYLCYVRMTIYMQYVHLVCSLFPQVFSDVKTRVKPANSDVTEAMLDITVLDLFLLNLNTI